MNLYMHQKAVVKVMQEYSEENALSSSHIMIWEEELDRAVACHRYCLPSMLNR